MYLKMLPTKAAAASERLVSLDAYRGLIMLSLAASGFGLTQVAKQHPDSAVWTAIGFQFEHPEWISQFHVVGCSYWDLIQPSFMFMVGVAMPFSYAKRAALGENWLGRALHALIRSCVLILMGVFLSSAWSQETNWSFVNVLSQIGLGYFFVFCLLGPREEEPADPLSDERPRSYRGVWTACQLIVAAAILAGYWYWFVQHPVSGASSYADHFAKNTNAAADVDRWLLNLFPRPEPFVENTGGYATLNFVPSIVTMLMGAMAGELLLRDRTRARATAWLVRGGGLCMVAAVAASYTVCPVVKRIWTPSWTLFSGAYALWILAAFHYIVDVKRFRAWVFPLVVLGTNSMLVYMLGQLTRKWTATQLRIHLGPSWFEGPYGPIVSSLAVTAVFWLICFWLYRQRIFLRV
ncbi:MAG: acyltransferase family protein [Pirellulaceae bacterium]